MDYSTVVPTFEDVRVAAARVDGRVRRTPVMTSRSIDQIAGCSIFFKCENLQRGGAFKFRGACNAVTSLSVNDAARGVVTQSSGNHGAAVALACRERGIACTVVVPANAPKIKLAAIHDFGARIVPCEVAQADRNRVTAEVLDQTGGVLIHPFNDARVIAGQGTAMLELSDDVDDLDCVIAPVSGGGLLSGTCIAAHGLKPDMPVFGAEPEGARDAHDSLVANERITGRKADTICDGLRAELGTLTFPILRDHVSAILLASDAQTIVAMRLMWERMKIVVEPSGAVGLACILGHRDQFAGRRVGLVVSGGNVDLEQLPWL